MGSHALLSGNPGEIEEILSKMCIKRELEEKEFGSKAFYKMRLYDFNQVRESLLEYMRSPDNDLIALSKSFFRNMQSTIKQQNVFIRMFNIQPDHGEDNELNIVSKGWYNMLRRQQHAHYTILMSAFRAANQDAEFGNRIAQQLSISCDIDLKIQFDSDKRFAADQN